jgi:hypothetical protein
VKCLDKRLRGFLIYAFILLLVIGIIVVLFMYVHDFFSIDLYNRIISVFIAVFITVMVLLTAATAVIFIAFRTRKVHPVMIFPVRLGMKLVIPFALFVAGALKKDKDMIRSLFIDINNLFVEAGDIRKEPDKIMLLLPHCLQNSECSRKITGDAANCINCGRCTIGAVREMAKEKGVKLRVVTGGTAARKAIADEKPEIVLSVACERDLAIGISDVSNIPVIGVLNKRPNGPCVNTTVDIGVLRDKLDSMIRSPEEEAEYGGCSEAAGR